MALFLEPQPALSPVAHDVLADDVLIAGSGAVMPIVIGDIAVRPPLRAYLIVGVVGFRSASYGSVQVFSTVISPVMGAKPSTVEVIV